MNDDLIATLDPQQRPLTAADRATADALLEQILAEPVSPSRTPFGTRRWQRAILPIAAAGTGVVGIALAANLGVLPGLTAAAPPQTAVPAPPELVLVGPAEPVDDDLVAQVVTACLEATIHVGPRPELTVLGAERRGDLVFVALGNDDVALDCTSVNEPGAPQPGLTWPDNYGPASMKADDAVQLGPRDIHPHYWQISADRFALRGYIGPDVTQAYVEVGHRRYPMTILPDGSFLAWGPASDELRTTTPVWTFHLTFADGTTRSVARA